MTLTHSYSPPILMHMMSYVMLLLLTAFYGLRLLTSPNSQLLSKCIDPFLDTRHTRQHKTGKVNLWSSINLFSDSKVQTIRIPVVMNDEYVRYFNCHSKYVNLKRQETPLIRRHRQYKPNSEPVYTTSFAN